MARCSCGAEPALRDTFCQQCGRRLATPTAIPSDSAVVERRTPDQTQPTSNAESGDGAARPPNLFVGLGERLDRFAAEGQSGGLIRGSLADAAAVVRQEPRRSLVSVAIVLAVGVVGALVVTILTVVLTLGSLAAVFGALSGSGDSAAGFAAGGLLLFILSQVIPAAVGTATVAAMYVAAAARYLPLLGHIPAYRHRGLETVSARWRQSFWPTLGAYLLVSLAAVLCLLPGIYVGGRVAFTTHEALAGDHSTGRSALGRSWDRTTSNVWPVIGLALLVALLAAVPLFTVGLLFFLLGALLEGSDSAIAGLILVLLSVLFGFALILPAALIPLPLAAAWLRITATEAPQHGSAAEPPPAAQPPPGLAANAGSSPPTARTGEVMPSSGDPAAFAPDLPVSSRPPPRGDPHPPTQHSPAEQAQADTETVQNPARDNSRAAAPAPQQRSSRERQGGACPNCGVQLKPGLRFCVACGRAATTSNPAPPP